MSLNHDHKHDSSRNIAIALLLNFSFAVLELVLGLWASSLAILSNALHDFGDTFSLGLSWYFEKVSKRGRTERYSYGFRRFSLIPVVINGSILLTGSGFIIYEAILRIYNPVQTRTGAMIAFALFGIAVNFVAYIRLRRGKSLNEQTASLHLLDDVLGLAAVLVVALAMKIWEVMVLDPLLSIAIALFVIGKTFRNIYKAGTIFLQGVPSHIDLQAVEEAILRIEGVLAVHDVHIWSLEGEMDIFTGHVVVDDALLENPDATKQKIKEVLTSLHIEHTTIELESTRYCSGIDCEI
jgi:cobalt-zinc-cadmium efflux system protein